MSLIYPHKKKSQGVKSELLHNVESVYFFYSNPVFPRSPTYVHTIIKIFAGTQIPMIFSIFPGIWPYDI